MTVSNPYNGLSKDIGFPERWVAVTPDADDYLEGPDADSHNVAIALMTPDGGTITYYDTYSGPKTIIVAAGAVLPGLFTRVTAFTGTNLYAAFIGDVVA